MAQKIITELLCDMHNDDTTPALDTISYTWAGTALELDVCQKHADDMDKKIAPFVALSRRVTGSNVRGIKSGVKFARKPSDAAKVREWARGQGIPVPDRGRMPVAITEQYAAAML